MRLDDHDEQPYRFRRERHDKREAKDARENREAARLKELLGLETYHRLIKEYESPMDFRVKNRTFLEHYQQIVIHDSWVIETGNPRMPYVWKDLSCGKELMAAIIRNSDYRLDLPAESIDGEWLISLSRNATITDTTPFEGTCMLVEFIEGFIMLRRELEEIHYTRQQWLDEYIKQYKFQVY